MSMSSEQENPKLRQVEVDSIQGVLDVFQEVLNWCGEINEDEARLPIDIVQKARQAINTATILFQPEKLRSDLPDSPEWWANAFGCSIKEWTQIELLIRQKVGGDRPLRTFLLISPNPSIDHDSIRSVQGTSLKDAIERFKTEALARMGDCDERVMSYYGEWQIYEKSEPSKALVYQGTVSEVAALTQDEEEDAHLLTPQQHRLIHLALQFTAANAAELIEALNVDDDRPETLPDTVAEQLNKLAQCFEHPVWIKRLKADRVPLPDLCLKTLLDIQGLLKSGFDTNIKAVLREETRPIDGLKDTILSLARTRAESLGISVKQVLNDVYPEDDDEIEAIQVNK
ncbi:hypothetical protein ACQ4M3_01040 [Leptolyngbya sp. AN03gr2]|uniref:hypothetical protein n=1 Tax=unclassified Leptolyngbya TaxID=2650499 RepID=UPI003D3120DB